MADIKISELQPTTDLEGLYTIGSDKNNLSKKVPLQFLREAADYAIEQGDYAKREGDSIESRITDFKAETDVKLTELSEEDSAITNAEFIQFNIAGNGYLSEGKIKTSSSSWYSDFIPVNAGKLYRIIVDKSQYDNNVAFYSGANFDSYIESRLTDAQSRLVDEIVSVPNGAAYMVVSSRKTSVFNIQCYDKTRAATNKVETAIQLIQEQLNNGELSKLLGRTANIFDPYKDSISPLQFYVKSDGTLVDNQDKIFTYFIKIGQATTGKYYNFKAFAEDDLSLSSIYLCTGKLEAGNIIEDGSGNVANKRGYVFANSDAELYLKVSFTANAENTEKAIERLNVIINSLVVTETTSQAYPTSYVPYQALNFSLHRENIDDSTINLYIKDSNGNLVGNKVQVKLGNSTPSTDVVNSNYLNSVKSITYKLGSNDITEAIVKGSGWSGNLTSGYTHTSGQTETLEFDLSKFNVGEKFILRFNCAGITSESSDVLISIGNAPSVKTYNGTSSFTLGFIATGGNLKMTPQSGFASTIKDISICKISEDGDEEITLEVDNVYAQLNNFITSFWNVAIGARDNTLNKLVNGSRNIAIGNYALKTIVSGNRNIGIGTFAMPFLTEAENNVAIGADTIYPLTKAKNCVGIGKATLGGSQSAEDCVAVGAGAMGVYSLNKDRFKCVAIGVNSGNSIVDSCTHVGYRAGANVAGARNTSIGYNSLAVGNRQTVDITGTDLTCVGSMAQIANTDTAKAATNSTAIGANTTITKSNQVIIGDSKVEEIILGGKRIIFNADGTCRWENA